VCKSVVEKLPTAVPEGSFSATLLFPKLMPLGASLTPLADTINGNGHSGSIGVANGIGYRVGETIGG